MVADLDSGLPAARPGTAEAGEVWQRVPGALTRRAPTFLLVACAEGGAPVRIEGGAIAVWEALATPGTTGTVVAAIAAATGARGDAVAGEITAALTALADAGIVRRG